jgi:hypothetical protein
MRVFAQWELNQFNAVFNTIQSVALGYDKNNPIQINQIRHGTPTQERPKASELQSVHRHVIIEVGGLENLSRMFCPANKKETMRWLIGYLTEKRIQPKEFELHGCVWIDHNQRYAEIVYETKRGS